MVNNNDLVSHEDICSNDHVTSTSCGTSTKRCTKCGMIKDIGEFYKNGNKTLHSWCKECCRKDNLRRLNNPDGCTKMRRREYYIQQHGLSLDNYKTLLDNQHNSCAICNKQFKEVTLTEEDKDNIQIDHDHVCCTKTYSCGKCIRGLLCGKCNRGLGYFSDDPRFFSSAIQEYLKRRVVFKGGKVVYETTSS